jgi:hypothetical protein
LQNDLPADIAHTLIHNKELRQAVLNKTDASHLVAHINELHAKLTFLQGAARQLSSIELYEIQELIEGMMLKMDMHTIFSRTKIKVNGTDFELAALLHVLLTADQVADVQISYSPHDLVEIIEVVFVLTDETRIIFRPSTPSDDPFAAWHPNGHCSYSPAPDRSREPVKQKPLIYLFVTNNWKGVSAKFRLMFKPRPMSCLLCGRTLTQDFYDGVEQSNIIFDLHHQLTELLV